MNNELLTIIMNYLQKWQIQLMQDGLNTKIMVKNDITHLMEMIENSKR